MNNFPFTLTTLANNPEYYEEVIALIEKEFRYSEKMSYAQDFALLMDTLNFENSYLYVDQKTNLVVAHLAVCKRIMIKANITIPVIFIGGIVTVPEFRGHNLFKKLMNHALEIHSKDNALFFLWSEITGMYEKFSFYLSGGLVETGQTSFSNNDRPIGFQKTTFKELAEYDFETVQSIYQEFNQKYFFTVLRKEKEWAIIKEATSIDLYVKRNSTGSIEQYFCINKGRDLTNIIHEIGCLPEQYLSFIKVIQKYKTWLPESELSISNNKELFFTAYMRLGNMELLNKFIMQLSNNEMVIYQISDLNINFKYQNIDYNVSPKDFLQFIFGPKPLKEFEKYQLSPYIAGTDSI
jgi:predicted acetyltransferase